MKKRVLLAAFPLLLFAQNPSIPMPPMPPMMQFPPPKSTNTTQPQKQNPQKPQPKKEVKKAPSTPKECELLPPMVYMLPPPMEAMLQKCKNALYLPKDKEVVAKRLTALYANPKVLSIKAVDGFERLYKIDVQMGANIKTLFCNQYITQCIDGSLLEIGKKK